MKGTRQRARRELVVSAAFSAAKIGYKRHTTKVSRVLAAPAETSDSLKTKHESLTKSNSSVCSFSCVSSFNDGL